jgi:glutamate racemase
MKIGFFDSGVGGLTVLKEALSQLPNELYIYYGDTKNSPYGEKSAEEIIECSKKAVSFLCEQGAEIIVVACNTASSAAGQILRESFRIPIICMEPAIKLAFKEEHKKILVLATNLTLHLDKYLVLKEKLNIGIDEIAAPKLVEFAERFEFETGEVARYLEEILSGYDLNNYSHIVLGCTHFSFFKKALQALLPSFIKVIDGNRGTINQLLTAGRQLSVNEPKIEICFTKENGFLKEIEGYLGYDIKTI